MIHLPTIISRCINTLRPVFLTIVMLFTFSDLVEQPLEAAKYNNRNKSLPAKIIILRHGEDQNQDSDAILLARGLERADALAQAAPNWPALRSQKPKAIFATSLHTILTIKPTADKFALPLIVLSTSKKFSTWQQTQKELNAKKDKSAVYYPNKDATLIETHGRVKRLVEELHKAQYAGTVVIVCWVHEEIPELVKSLGYTKVPHWPNAPLQKKGKVFDRFWVLDTTRDKKDKKGRYIFDSKENDLPERLLASDSVK